MGRHTAFRFTVDPLPSQVVVLARHAGASRFAYNQCLRLVKDALTARAVDSSVEVPWSRFDLINTFNAWKVSAAAGRLLIADASGEVAVVATGLAWRTEVSAQVFEEAAVDLDRALDAYSASRRGQRAGRRVGFPRFKHKSRDRRSFRIRQKTSGGRGCIRVGEDAARSVTLPRIGTLKVREDTRKLRRMLRTGRATIASATVSWRAGRWTVAVTVKAADLHPARQHPPRPDGDPTGWVGVDRGLAAYVVAARATGQQVFRQDDPPRPLRAAQGRLRRLSRQVSRKKKGSANRATAVARLGRVHARIRNVRQALLHEVANELVQTHDRLALETLNITGMMANHRLAGAIGDAAWGELGRIIAYKQSWRGGQQIAVDRWFPSTKTCSRCHTVAAVVPLSARVFECGACGYRADRDRNAAVNLAVWAEQHHARTRDLDARGPVINAFRGDGSGPHLRVSETSPRDGRTRPSHPARMSVGGTPEEGGGS
ncbi:RNA-guided endonuclease InsQ/TnpB family protein [Rugosimonospora africana]|uniref:Resolvase n=1 Tax=Rugosimonospora africana TaxID=556532 RepID=A0A8J3QW78_9ACTN|nr:RNA-guided endonuclease TnpB family protein [Rugosimonospora africana]GIH16943.1 resolvase [Rugosimonospora africana]